MVNCKKVWDQLGISLFERLFRRPRQISITLPIQYRMQPAICQWPSEAFYGNELVCAPDMKVRALPGGMEWSKGERLCFVHVPGCEVEYSNGNYANRYQAEVVQDILYRLRKYSDVPDDQLGMITPYRKQVEILTDLLGDRHTIATVDNFQGS